MQHPRKTPHLVVLPEQQDVAKPFDAIKGLAGRVKIAGSILNALRVLSNCRWD